jgi:acyl-CoA dehydrogenase
MPGGTDKYQDLRDALRALCSKFPPEYFRRLDAGLAGGDDPAEQYGGSGLGLAEASVIMEEINRAGGNAGACHGQMYNMGTLLRHGSRRRSALPAAIAAASCACSRWP